VNKIIICVTPYSILNASHHSLTMNLRTFWPLNVFVTLILACNFNEINSSHLWKQLWRQETNKIKVDFNRLLQIMPQALYATLHYLYMYLLRFIGRNASLSRWIRRVTWFNSTGSMNLSCRSVQNMTRLRRSRVSMHQSEQVQKLSLEWSRVISTWIGRAQRVLWYSYLSGLKFYWEWISLYFLW
jgi:hypothetical protein